MICRQAREGMLFLAADPGDSSGPWTVRTEGPHKFWSQAGAARHGRSTWLAEGELLLTQLLVLVNRLLLAHLEALGLLGRELVVVVLGAGHDGGVQTGRVLAG